VCRTIGHEGKLHNFGIKGMCNIEIPNEGYAFNQMDERVCAFVVKDHALIGLKLRQFYFEARLFGHTNWKGSNLALGLPASSHVRIWLHEHFSLQGTVGS
jgi:hypothetical protein